MMTMTLDELGKVEWNLTVSETDSRFEEYVLGENWSDWTSWVIGNVVLNSGPVRIGFYWIADGGKESYREAFDFTLSQFWPDKYYAPWIAGIEIVDDDGDPVSDEDLSDWIKKDISWEQEVRKILPTPGTDNVDSVTTETNDMEQFEIQRDNGPSLKFSGEKIGFASSSAETVRSDYSGSVGRWCELSLYKTAGGKFVCQMIGRTQWQGEHDRYTAQVCENETEVVDFFGHGWLAKELYTEAGIDASEKVE